jgi:hypothetical protein
MSGIWVIVILIWVFQYYRHRQSGGQTARAGPLIPAEVRVCLARLVVSGMTPAIIPLIDGIGEAIAGPGHADRWSAVVGILVLTLFLALIWFPTIMLEWIIVPLRLPRVAFWLARIFRPLGFAREAVAGGVVYGAMTLIGKRGSPHAVRTADWLAHKLATKTPLYGGAVVAAALLAIFRKDCQRARRLFLVADTLPPRIISRKARGIARDWLVMNAMRSGDWREIIRLARRREQNLRWSYTVARFAERLLGDEQASPNWLLWQRWILAPRRRASLPLLRRALAVPRGLPPPTVPPQTSVELPAALAGFAQVLKTARVDDGSSLMRTISEIDTALEASATQSRIEERLRALGAHTDVSATIAGFRGQLVDFLVPLLETSPRLASAQQREPILEQAVARVRQRLFKDISVQCQDYGERKNREAALGELAEWEVWATLRHSADRLLVLDPAAEPALFEQMWPVCNNFAVFQHNICKRTTLAYEIYAWLRRHSHLTSASELLDKNVRAASDSFRR